MLLNELNLLAERLSLYRKYRKAGDYFFKNTVKKFNKERYKEWFGDKYKIFIPLKDSVSADVESTLKLNGYFIIDYKNGIAGSTKDDRQYKIGKLLNKFKEFDLLKDFNEDETRTSTKLKSKKTRWLWLSVVIHTT